MRRILIVLFLSFFLSSAFAQYDLRYEVEGNVIAGTGDYTPFYLLNNRHGQVSFDSNNGYLRAALFRDMEKDKRFSYAFGVDVVGGYRQYNTAYLQQLYAQIKYKCLGLFVGAKNDCSIHVDSGLSSGDYLHSGNARPIPQIRIGIPEFTDIVKGGLIKIKCEIAYGYFMDGKYQRDVRTNPKLFYSRRAFSS